MFCHIASKAEGAGDPQLRQKKGLTGLPSLAYLDAAGTVLVRVPSDDRSLSGISRHGLRATEYIRLRALAAKGDDAGSAGFLVMQLAERQVALADARRRFAAIGKIPTDLRPLLETEILHLDIGTRMRAVGQKKRHTLGPEFWRMWQEGPRPGPHVSRGFWFTILEWSEREKQVEVFSEALDAFRGALIKTDGGKLWVSGLLARYEDKLKAMRQ